MSDPEEAAERPGSSAQAAVEQPESKGAVDLNRMLDLAASEDDEILFQPIHDIFADEVEFDSKLAPKLDQAPEPFQRRLESTRRDADFDAGSENRSSLPTFGSGRGAEASSLFSGLEVEGPDHFRSHRSLGPARPRTIEALEFTASQVDEALERYFGFTGFREGQREVIEAVLSGRDVLAVMPTSAGKSLLYQLPAMLLPGVTLIISPLISLMKDQVDKLRERGLPAGFINSSQSDSEREELLEGARRGDIKLLFVAPERFRSRVFRRLAAELNVSLFAVDEAHCVSSWGHDFRPDYLKLKRAIELCGHPPVLAVTATATDVVRKDIELHLGLRPGYFKLIAGFDRPNLRLEVAVTSTTEEKMSMLANLARRIPGTGIIYCATRKNTEKVAEAMSTLGLSVEVYHAGLDANRRREVQERFMNGELRLVAATNAFGMGIDKNDVRFVAHYDLPGSIEAYYQEAGRAGRDGLPSECLLLFRPGDIYTQEFLIDCAYPSREIIEDVYRELLKLDDGRNEVTLNDLVRRVPQAKSDRTVGAALRLLDEAEHIDRGGRLDNPARIRKLNEPQLGGKSAAQKLFGRLIQTFRGRLEIGVALPLSEIAYATGASIDQLRKLLPDLRKGGYLEYIPPFAGRSVTVLYPKVPISGLKVDFNAVTAQRQRERDRLQRVIDLAYSPICRRAYILNYFGAPTKTDCGNCDICAPQGGGSEARSLTDDELIVLKKLLSCVVRMKGRFGRAKVVQVLRGSRAKDIVDFKLDKLSTHGILSDWSQEALTRLLGESIKRGLCRESRDEQGRYPKVEVTELGRDVLFDRQRVKLVMPGARTSKRRQTAAYTNLQARGGGNNESEDLFQALRSLRMDLAREKQVKPFMIFPDRTLRAIAEARPGSQNDLRSIPGIGEAKLKQFGRKIVDFIASYES